MFKHYLTTALRNLRRQRLASAINVMGLSLGLICFIVSYAVVSYLRSSESAFENAERTFIITQLSGGTFPISSGPLAKYLKLDFPELAAVARSIKGAGDDKTYLRVGEKDGAVAMVFADAEFLDIFHLRFLVGDDRRALREPRSIILTEKTANQFFGTTDVLGKRVVLNHEPLTVTGVIAAIPQPSHLSDSPVSLMGFEALASMDVVERLVEVQTGESPQAELWSRFNYFTYVQLPDNGSLSAAALNNRLVSFGQRRVPPENADRTFIAKPISSILFILGDAIVGSIAALLMGLGAVVLAVACLNYVNLATAQASSRAKEVGLRKTLGASRTQVLIQQLFETSLLTLVACAVALLAVVALFVALNASLGIDLRIVLMSTLQFWAFLIAVVTGVSLLAGAYPALVTSRVRPAQALRTGRGVSGGRRFASLLVGVQFAVASFLVIAVVGMYRQNVTMHRSLVTRSDPVVVLDTNLKTAGIDLEALRTELSRSEQIKFVSATQYQPWGSRRSIHVVSGSADRSAESRRVLLNSVAHDFFQTFDMKLLAGRWFDRQFHDEPLRTKTSAISNIVIDRALAEQLGHTDPTTVVDSLIYTPSPDSSRAPKQARVVGVIENKPMTIIGVGGATANIYSLEPQQTGIAVVRIDRNSIAGALAEIDSAWKRLAPDTPLHRVFADELFEESYRFLDSVRQVFAGITIFAFVTAAMGLIGMAVHVVTRRTHEIGVRKTLGASQLRVLSLVLWDFSRPVLIANLIACPVAALVVFGYQSVMVQRAPFSVFPFLFGLAITVLIAWAAVATHAWRAARMNPATVLRHE